MARFFNFRAGVDADFRSNLELNSQRYDEASQAEVYLTITATSLVAIVGVIQTMVQANGADKTRDQILSGLVTGIPVFLGFLIAVCNQVAKTAAKEMRILVNQGVAAGHFDDNAADATTAVKATSERNVLARLGLASS